jgi:hypothetical protein
MLPAPYTRFWPVNGIPIEWAKMKYAIKKSPAPKPKAVGDNPRSWFIVSAAKPTLTRSREAADDEEQHATLRNFGDGADFHRMLLIVT